MYALLGGRVWSCASLEMYYTCRTKVICKQKRNPIENMLLCHGTTPCFCVPRACLITFKEHFQTAFWEACQHFFFPQEIFITIWVLPSLFSWFEYWIINVLSALPHQAQHTSAHIPPSRGWLSTMKRVKSKYKDIILHGCNVQGKGRQVIANKGQVISPTWLQVQGTTYWVPLTGLINFTASCSLFI